MKTRPSVVAVVSVVTLSVAMAATTTVFSVVDAAMLRPFPYHEPERIVWIDHTLPAQKLEALPVSYPNIADWKDRSRSFSDVAAFQYATFHMDTARVPGLQVDPALFPLLGREPKLGRVLEKADDHAAVISYGLWQRTFGADPRVLGQTIRLDGQAHTIVGVMPPGFHFPEVCDVWAPLGPAALRTGRGERGFRAVARLRPGIRTGDAASEMWGVHAQLAREHPGANGELGVRVIPLREYYIDDERMPLLLALAAVLLVVAIACCNVGGLLLARAAARRKETAMRAALGASRWRIARASLIESLTIASGAAVLGALLASLALDAIVSSIPMRLPVWLEFRLDGRVLAFTSLVCAFSALAFGMAPVLNGWRTNLMDALRMSGSGAGVTARGRRILVAAEVALALVVLVLASLLVRTFGALCGEGTGFDQAGVMAAQVELPPTTPAAAFLRSALSGVRALPGVEMAGATSQLPLRRGAPVRKLTIEGRASAEAPVASARAASPGYFETMRIPLVAGRLFRDGDDADAPRVALVSQSAASRFWPDTSPVGARVKLAAADELGRWVTVVGVVGDVRQSWFGPDMRTAIYVPLAQSPASSVAIVARASASSSSALRSTLASLDRDAAIEVITMRQVVEESFWRNRLYAVLFGMFAAAALVLAAAGVLALVLYSVAVSRRDLAIRAAIGAGTRQVIVAAASHGLKPAGIGAIAGLAVAFPVAGLLRGAMFGVAPHDPLTLAGAPLLLMAVAAAACVWPCRQVARINPAEALRDDGTARRVAGC